MKRFVALVLAVACLCGFTAVALAEGKLKTTSYRLIVYNGEDNGYFFAKVENTGDKSAGVDTGDLVIFSADDDIVTTESYVTTLPSYVALQPGDYLYVSEYLWDDALEGVEFGDCKLSMPVEKGNKSFTKIDCQASYDPEAADDYHHYIDVTISNTTEKMIGDGYVTVALFDEDGVICFAKGHDLSNVQIHPGSTITVKLYIEQNLVDYYRKHDINPVTVDAYVCCPD